ncbi:MAG: phosphoribosyltransferase [Planctomycetota bacterium]|jgi:hypoxanthine phosphoribosyltransferase
MQPDLPVLISRAALRRRLQEIAGELLASHHRQADPPLYVMVMEGARVFAEELLALLPGGPLPARIRVSSYGDGQESCGSPRIQAVDPIDPRGRQLVILEDIVDTGHTARSLLDHFAAMEPASICLVSMLAKPSRREVQVPIAHWGFEIPDLFVVGYGMDFAGEYRELPEVRVLNQPPSPSGDGLPAEPTP